MCVLYACETGVPSLDELKRAADANPHGAGVAWIEGGMAHWQKGIDDPEAMHEFILTLPLPILVHFRWASAGGIDPALTHPFPVTRKAGTTLSGRARRVLAHNGHIGSWESMKKRAEKVARKFGGLPAGPWSDTRLVAYLAGCVGAEHIPTIATGQKVALLDAQKGLTVFNGKFWHKGVRETGGYWQSSSTESRFSFTSFGHGFTDKKTKTKTGALVIDIASGQIREDGGGIVEVDINDDLTRDLPDYKPYAQEREERERLACPYVRTETVADEDGVLAGLE